MNTSSYRSLTRDPFWIGPWQVISAEQRMQRGEHTVPLPRAPLLLLRYLAVHANEAVPPEVLQEILRADDRAEDDAEVPQLLAALHQTLHTAATDPRIETTPEGHVRLVATVEFYDPVTRHRRGRTSFKVAGQRKWFDIDDTVDEDRAFEQAIERRRTWIKRLAVLAVLAGVLLYALYIARQAPAPSAPSVTVTAEGLPGFERDGVLSPDGDVLAFSYRATDTAPWHIYTRPSDGGAPQQRTNTASDDHQPAWSPDGTRLAFLRYAAAEPAVCDIYLLDLAAGTEQRLAACGRKPMHDLAWSPDGTTLVFSTQPDAQASSHLVALEIATGTRTALTEPPPAITGDTDPAFSPDGRWIAFTRRRHPEDADLYMLPAAGGQPRRLTNDHAPIRGLAWMPDAQSLLFSAGASGNFRLWQLSLETGTRRLFPTPDFRTRYPSVAHQKKRLAYQHQPLNLHIWQGVLTPPGQPAQPLLTAHYNEQPAFAPHDDRIAFISWRGGSAELWMQEPTRDDPDRVTTMYNTRVSIPRWSPDGKHLAFVATPRQNFDLFTVDATGGTARPLSKTPQDELAPSWSHDGTWIYFASQDSGTWEVWRTRADGSGPREQVTRNGGRVALEDAEGAWLYYTKPQQPGLWRMALPDGAEEQVLDALDPVDSGNWVPTSAGIYFVRRLPDGSTPVAFFDFTSGEATDVFLPPDPIPGFSLSLSISHDQRRLLFSQYHLEESDLVVLDLPE